MARTPNRVRWNNRRKRPESAPGVMQISTRRAFLRTTAVTASAGDASLRQQLPVRMRFGDEGMELIFTCRNAECHKSFKVGGRGDREDYASHPDVTMDAVCPYCLEPNPFAWPMGVRFFLTSLATQVQDTTQFSRMPSVAGRMARIPGRGDSSSRWEEESMWGQPSSIKSVGERHLLIDTDIHQVPESAGVIVLYGVNNDPVYVKSVSNLRIALLQAKRKYASAIEFALSGLDCDDEKSRTHLEKVLRTAFSLRETRDKEVVFSEGSSV